MRNIVIIGLGGFAGSILRYLVSGWVQRLSDNALFPYGTLGVNVLGCLAIGLLGALTTLFIFGYETVEPHQ